MPVRDFRAMSCLDVMTLERGQSGGVAQKLQSYAVRGSDQLSRALHRICVCIQCMVRSRPSPPFAPLVVVPYPPPSTLPTPWCSVLLICLFLSLSLALFIPPLFSFIRYSLVLVSLGSCSGVIPLFAPIARPFFLTFLFLYFRRSKIHKKAQKSLGWFEV